MLGIIQSFVIGIACVIALSYAWHRLPAAFASQNVIGQSPLASTTNDLDVKYLLQEDLLCVPTSASMIMAFYGDRHSPRKLKTMSRGIEYSLSKRFDDFTITYYRDIIRAARALGYEWHEQIFEDNDLGFRRGLAVVKDEIVRRHPVMIDLSMPEGHTIVITGFDERTQAINVVDPNASAPGRYSISYDDLQSMWNEHAFNGNFRSLVTTSPRKRLL